MARINNYAPSEVLISVREPYNKNTVWIHPVTQDELQIKVFNNGWKVLCSNKDGGLSPISKVQVDELIETLNTNLQEILVENIKKLQSENALLISKLKNSEKRIDDLYEKLNNLEK